MADGSWDGEAPPAAPRGRSRWGGWLAGCGIAAVVGLSVLAVGGLALANRRMADPEVKTKLGRAFLPLVQDLVEDLKTDEGTRALYTQQPGLHARYPTEEAFLAQVRPWRPSLATMPAGPEATGALETRVSLQGMGLEVRLGDGRRLRLRVQGQGRRRLPLKDLEVR